MTGKSSRLITTILAGLTLLLAGCGNQPAASTDGPKYDTDKYKVAVMVCDAEMRSSSNQSVWAGADKFSKETGIEIKWFSAAHNAEADGVIEQILSEGFTVVINANGDDAAMVKQKAQENPDVLFAQIDGVLDPTGVANLVSASVQAQQPAFLAGYIAARKTETGKVGFLAGTYNIPGLVLEAGFVAGVAYANKEKGTSVQIETRYVGNAYNRDGGYDGFDRLLSDGSDIIFIATGGDTGNGALYAAKVTGGLCVAMGDSEYLAPNSVLAAVSKKIDAACYETALGLVSGTIKGGQTVLHGFNDGQAGFIATKNTEGKLGTELFNEVKALAEQLKANEIDIPMDTVVAPEV
ncbi:MAG: BMP family ABC transporter substrate-binding protein [Oscillospiraceae bacterium]|jgi:basic membrane protein A|nr:BMP family ABC transporter substrate-binding protein [Oscillospiraceae bacterium]